MEQKNKQTKKKVYSSIALITVLFIMLAITTYALLLSLVSVDDNLFKTQQIEINLNDGKTVFDGSDVVLEPGGSVRKEFTLENSGNADAYYRLYFQNVSGSLQDNVVFAIYDGDKLLYEAPAKNFNKENPCISDVPLGASEKKVLSVVAKMPENIGKESQDGFISFDLTADAVQARNNSQKSFE